MGEYTIIIYILVTDSSHTYLPNDRALAYFGVYLNDAPLSNTFSFNDGPDLYDNIVFNDGSFRLVI